MKKCLVAMSLVCVLLVMYLSYLTFRAHEKIYPYDETQIEIIAKDQGKLSLSISALVTPMYWCSGYSLIYKKDRILLTLRRTRLRSESDAGSMDDVYEITVPNKKNLPIVYYDGTNEYEIKINTDSSENNIKEKLKVGMTYSDVVELLGEPESNVGYGKIVASWKLNEYEWFFPIFEGDKVVKMEFFDKRK